jgi:hypothetical protein
MTFDEEKVYRKYRPAFINELTTIRTCRGGSLHPYCTPSRRNVMFTMNARYISVQSAYIETQQNGHCFEETALYSPCGMMWTEEAGEVITGPYLLII